MRSSSLDRSCVSVPWIPVLTALAIVSGLAACSDESTDFVRARVAPTGLFLSGAATSAVDLRWSHDGSADGFEIERWIGSPNGDPEIFPVGPADDRFTDTTPPDDRTVWYRVRAVYGEARSGASNRVNVNLDLLGPLVVSAAADDPEWLRVRWVPPDFQNFDAFLVNRVLVRGGELVGDGSAIVEHSSPEAVVWLDSDFPTGAPGDRLYYLVSLQNDEITSAPVEADPRLQWSLPTIPDLVSLDVREHQAAEARYLPDVEHVILMTRQDDGNVQLRALESIGTSTPRAVRFSTSREDGEIAGTMPSVQRVVVAHRPAGSTNTTFTSVALPTETTEWETTIPDAAVGVWNAPEPGMVAYAVGSRVEIVDPASGDGIRTMTIDPSGVDRVDAVAFPAPDRIATVVNGSGLTVSTYPAGELVWSVPAEAGVSIVSAPAALLASANGDRIALSVRGGSGSERFDIHRTTDGRSLGSGDGRAIGFFSDGTNVIALEAMPGALRAFIVDGETLASGERFGSINTSAGYVHPASGSLATTHTVGAIKLWSPTRRWTLELEETRGGPAGPDPDLVRVRRFEIRDDRAVREEGGE